MEQAEASKQFSGVKQIIMSIIGGTIAYLFTYLLKLLSATDALFLAMLVAFAIPLYLNFSYINSLKSKISSLTSDLNNVSVEQTREFRVLNTKLDATTEFTFSLNTILVTNGFIKARDVDDLSRQYLDKLKPIMEIGPNPLDQNEIRDYNELMRKLNSHTLLDPDEIGRLRKYLEREKAEAENRGNSNALFGIIIALGVIALLTGIAASRDERAHPRE